VGRDRPRITVVGLGPAGDDYLTTNVRDLLARSRRTFLRTVRHPAAMVVDGAESFDHLYETAATFEEVYQAIVEELIAAAADEVPEPVLYAVPGSPLVAERTVELLRADTRVEVTVIPSLSFLDLAWERLGVDPLSSGVQLVDAESFAVGEGGTGPFLVAQCWSKPMLSVVKLTLDFNDDEPVPEAVLLHHLGLPDEQIMSVPWWDLDRALVPDHLTSLYIPELPQRPGLQLEMARLQDLVHTLRERCPWDRAQTHGTLMPHLVEESYEVLDALRVMDAEVTPGAAPDSTAAKHLEEELGDLLFQIVFHARLAEDAGSFTLADVARTVHDKLVHRHPHVFGDVRADSADEVVANWEVIKKEEKGRSSITEGIPTALPALLLSTKLARKAMSVGLPDPAESESAQLVEQLTQLAEAHRDETPAKADGVLNSADTGIERLVGEVLFGVANLARRAGIDPEQALRGRALEFRETIIRQEGNAPG